MTDEIGTDWIKKWDALKRLCGRRKVDICRKVYGGTNYPSNVPENFHKWRKKFNPTLDEFVEFFDRVARFLGCKSDIDGLQLIRCNYDQFVRLMSHEMRARLVQETGRTHYATFNIDLDSHAGELEKAWVADRVVDQRYMYLDRRSVDGWNEVISLGSYDMYENCKRVLDEFLTENEDWVRILESGKLGSIVMLGAGAPEKDKDILNKILGSSAFEENEFKYVVFDSSFYMLADTIREIEPLLNKKDAQGNVELIPCCADFLKLRAWEKCIRPVNDAKVVVLFILGGTIGNIEESAFFDAIKHVTKDGDLLVISQELIDEVDQGKYEQKLKSNYDLSETRDFALGPVRDLLDEEGHAREDEARRLLVDVEIEDALALPAKIRSNIPGTRAAVFRLKPEISGLNLVLVASKRHREEALKKAVIHHEFEFRRTHCVPRKSLQHKYLVFERRNIESAEKGKPATKTRS